MQKKSLNNIIYKTQTIANPNFKSSHGKKVFIYYYKENYTAMKMDRVACSNIDTSQKYNVKPKIPYNNISIKRKQN